MISLILIIAICGFVNILANSCPDSYKLIDFEILGGTIDPIPSIYQGLTWLDAYYMIASLEPGSGYEVPLRSGGYIAFNAHGAQMSIGAPASSSIAVHSFVAAAAWNDDLVLTITGDRNGATVYSEQVILNTTSATNVVLNWTNIDNISFSTSGGVPANANSAGNGTHFAMDDLCVLKEQKRQPEILYKCDYWGDPQLITFPKQANEFASSSWCQINGSSVLFENSYVLINVFNSGSNNGDVITEFNMTFFDSYHNSMCTFTQENVAGELPNCGSEVSIVQSSNSLNVAYKKASFSAWISYNTWHGGHYKFNLFTTLNRINDPSTTGLCIEGCPSKRMAPQLLLTDSTTDQEIATSAIASHVCDAYITTAAQRVSQNSPAVQMTPGYLHAVRRACIIDVTVTGDADFARDSASNIVTDILTHAKEPDIDNISHLVQDATQATQQVLEQTETQVQTMIDGAIWPCSPNAPVCIMPSLIRRKQVTV
ncbi:unnamed protein product [Adineta ricciae]|uniref:Uncharacterized protein n=1 Tax=Adineta ricciae TaxID=249248 RepID=A0A816CZG8_ADIRI|nr:unnamed protein product [Adineta ricciae]